MRHGFTSGSCAAAAAKASAYMLLTGRIKTEITIDTPKGICYHAKLLDISRSENIVSCAVRKDGGDAPDETTSLLIYAQVQLAAEGIQIEGGEGVGRVMRKGLDQPVGNAAINSVPRKMIQEEVKKVCDLLDYHGGLQILICVPEGEHVAKQTFNERLGIIGGISILGTSGIVEPMSAQALLDTIRVELNQKYAEGQKSVVVSPGNYGQDFMKNTYQFDLDKSVKCSNFIGQTIDMAGEIGFEEILFVGHIGKLIKLSGGIMNTHSHEGDCRMELLAASAVRAGASLSCVQDILSSISTEDAVQILKVNGFLEETMELVMKKISYYLSIRAGRIQENLHIACMVFCNEEGLLGETSDASLILQKLKNQ